MLEYLSVGMLVFLACEMFGFSRWMLVPPSSECAHEYARHESAIVIMAAAIIIVMWPATILFAVIHAFALAVKGR